MKTRKYYSDQNLNSEEYHAEWHTTTTVDYFYPRNLGEMDGTLIIAHISMGGTESHHIQEVKKIR